MNCHRIHKALLLQSLLYRSAEEEVNNIPSLRIKRIANVF